MLFLSIDTDEERNLVLANVDRSNCQQTGSYELIDADPKTQQKSKSTRSKEPTPSSNQNSSQDLSSGPSARMICAFSEEVPLMTWKKLLISFSSPTNSAIHVPPNIRHDAEILALFAEKNDFIQTGFAFGKAAILIGPETTSPFFGRRVQYALANDL